MTGEGRDVATASGASLPDQELPGDTVSTALPEVGIEETRFLIGPQNEWEATLPLSPAEAFLATPHQRAHIGRIILDTILAENPGSRRWGFSRLRDEIMKRTGLRDVAASLVVFAREDELEEV